MQFHHVGLPQVDSVVSAQDSFVVDIHPKPFMQRRPGGLRPPVPFSDEHIGPVLPEPSGRGPHEEVTVPAVGGLQEYLEVPRLQRECDVDGGLGRTGEGLHPVAPAVDELPSCPDPPNPRRPDLFAVPVRDESDL